MIGASFGGCHQCCWVRGGCRDAPPRGFGRMEHAVRSEANIKVGSECGTAGGNTVQSEMSHSDVATGCEPRLCLRGCAQPFGLPLFCQPSSFYSTPPSHCFAADCPSRRFFQFQGLRPGSRMTILWPLASRFMLHHQLEGVPHSPVCRDQVPFVVIEAFADSMDFCVREYITVYWVIQSKSRVLLKAQLILKMAQFFHAYFQFGRKDCGDVSEKNGGFLGGRRPQGQQKFNNYSKLKSNKIMMYNCQ